MAASTVNTNKPIIPRGVDDRPVDKYNRAELYSGKALDFDGVNDYVTLDGFAGTLSNNDAFTICGLFKSNKTTGRGTWFSAHTSSGGNIIRVWVEPAPTNDGIWFADVTTGDVQIGSYDVNDDHWYHIALSRPQGSAGTEVTLYINGIASGTLGTGTDWGNAELFSLGQEYDGGPSVSDFFDGQIAGFKIFNTALTAAQVADLYNNPEKIVPTGVSDSALKLWLPMQEGAGTTAYDGSGNGNHGTISGATWTHGIGAPVSQTAVIDWNKGTNEFQYSEEFNSSYWTKVNTIITANATTAPDGQTTAESMDSTSSNEVIYRVVNAGTYSFSVYAKAGTTTSFQLAGTTSFNGRGADFDLINGTAGAVYQVGSGNAAIIGGTSSIESVGNGWYRCSINALTFTAARALTFANNNGDLSYIWGASVEQSATAGPYVRTGATAQTSPVLLPQGLTSGRDITGVNLFENVRKQGALNLDGNSWADVHDNESLDITDAITLEAWIDNTNTYDSIRYLFDKSNGATNGFEFRLTSQNGVQLVFRNLSTISKVATIPTSGWVHVVTTYDGANIKMYIDGSLQNTTASTGTITANDYPLTIGGDIQNSNYSLNKPIALPRIYNRALTATEVARNYNADRSKFGL